MMIVTSTGALRSPPVADSSGVADADEAQPLANGVPQDARDTESRAGAQQAGSSGADGDARGTASPTDGRRDEDGVPAVDSGNEAADEAGDIPLTQMGE
mmetsp:Transcript_4871/g.12567  ORF Transcript_4871/g.12567 Transcript_4871/m.12567 type:complete len:99 (+) Transcript_4871:825-1121(+)